MLLADAQAFSWSDLRPTALSFICLALTVGTLLALVTADRWRDWVGLFTTRFWPPQRHRAVPWAFRDVVIVLVLALGMELVLLPVFGGVGEGLAQPAAFTAPGELQRLVGAWAANVATLSPWGCPEQGLVNSLAAAQVQALFVSRYRWLHVGMAICRIATMAVVLLYLTRRGRALPLHLLLTTHDWRANLWRGYLIWFAVTLPLTCLYLVLLQSADYIGERVPHSVETYLTLSPWPGDYILALVLTLLISPLVEELLMRGIVQPLFIEEPMIADAFILTSLVLAIAYGLSESVNSSWVWGPLVFVLLVGPGYLAFEWLTRRCLPRPGAARGIFAVALLFAMLHSPIWPSPVPIFLLGLALGILAYRTQSLTGCVLAHTLFNAVSMFAPIVARP
jgi:membrane protease YdiL (CAAX protease family)